MSSIIEFPLPDRPVTEEEIAKLHSKAFRDLEDKVHDLDRMGEINGTAGGGLGARRDECAMPGAGQLRHPASCGHAARLQKDYYAAWHGEPEGRAS